MPSGARPRSCSARRLAALVLLAAAATLALAAPALATTATPNQTAAGPTSALGSPLVVIGVGGLSWDDIDATTTPRLWSLLDDGASAAAVTVTMSTSPVCPSGGWLGLSAGRQAFSPHDGDLCRPLPAVTPSGSGATIAGWGPLSRAEGDTTYEATIGTLGGALATGTGCFTAVGPGAAVALADPAGQVERYLPTLDGSAFDCPLTVVDAGATSDLDASVADVRAVDDLVGQVLDEAPASASVLVISVSTPEGGRVSLGTAILRDPQAAGDYLTSPATRRAGVIRLLDVPSTIVAVAGVAEPVDFQGSVLELGAHRPGTTGTVQHFVGISVADRWLRLGTSPLINTTGAAAILLGGLVLLIGRRRISALGRRPLETALLIVAAAPIASYLVTLTRWWRYDDPYAAMWIGIAAIAAVLGIAASLCPGPLWRPALVISLVTTAVLLVDGVIGTPLHWASPFGTSAALGNRYYGFGNSTYAIWAVHTLVLAGVWATRYVTSGRHRLAGVIVLSVGVVSVIVDIWPTWGADVGGGVALVPAFVVMAMMLSGIRVTPVRAVVAAVGGVAVVTLVAVADWLRPAAQRSHAGQFVQRVLDGDASDLVGRKISYAIASFSRGPAAWISLAVLVLLFLALVLPRMMPAGLGAAIERWPQLRAVIVAILISAVLGSLANDWGIRVATVELIAAAPLVLAACLRASAYEVTAPVLISRSDANTDRSPSATAAPKTTSATAAAATPPTTAPRKETSAKR